MTFHIDDEQRQAVSDSQPGPAGVVTARFGHDFGADVDVAEGVVLRVVDLSFVRVPERLALLRGIVASGDALDAVRRIVTSSVYTAEEPQDDERLGVLDRVLARLELETAVPELMVHPGDRELVSAVQILRADTFDVPLTPLGELRVQAVRDAVRGKLPDLGDIRSTGELLEQQLSDESVWLGVREVSEDGERPVGLPSVVLLSAGPDLAVAMTGRSPYVDRLDELDVALVLPVASTYRGADRLACYLVEPAHDHPIAHISLFAEDMGRSEDGVRSLVAQFRLSERHDLADFEFVVLPAGLPGGPLVKPSAARSLMCGEVRLRTAIRLAQRGQQQEALARLRDAEQEYRTARESVPEYYWQRLREIRRRIEDDDYPSDLISDSVPVMPGPTRH